MQYNIFQNDFYDDRPGLIWAYRIDFVVNDVTVAKLAKAVKEIDLPTSILDTFTVYFGGHAFDIPTRYKKDKEISAIFYDDKNLSVYREILKIFRRSYDNREQNASSRLTGRVISNRYDNLGQSIGTKTFQGQERVRKYSNQKGELLIKVYIIDPEKINYRDTQPTSRTISETEELITGLTTNDPEVEAVYTFRDCYITGIDDVTFDYSSEEVLEWPIRILYNEVSVEYPHQDRIVIPELQRSRSDYGYEELAIPDRMNDDSQKYSPKVDTSVETESNGKHAEKLEALARKAYERANKELDRIKEEANTRREDAVAKATAAADSDGMLPNGDFNTAANREKSVEGQLEKPVQKFVEEHNIPGWAEIGVNMLANKAIVKEQSKEVETAVVLEGGQTEEGRQTGFGLADWNLRQQIMGEKQSVDADLSDLMKLEEDVRIANAGAGAVDMNDTQSTDQWYAEDKRGKEYFDKTGSEIGILKKATGYWEEDREEAIGDLSKNRKQRVEHGTITQDQFMEGVDRGLAKKEAAEQGVVDSMNEYDELSKKKKPKLQTRAEIDQANK
jgi:hypothetical protein